MLRWLAVGDGTATAAPKVKTSDGITLGCAMSDPMSNRAKGMKIMALGAKHLAKKLITGKTKQLGNVATLIKKSVGVQMKSLTVVMVFHRTTSAVTPTGPNVHLFQDDELDLSQIAAHLGVSAQGIQAVQQHRQDDADELEDFLGQTGLY